MLGLLNLGFYSGYMIKTQNITLPNNLRVLVTPMSSTEAVTVMILVRAGSRFEDKKTSGISHFLEHMFFKGGERYPNPKAVSEAIDNLGGSFNAFTSYEYVGYYVKVAKHHIVTAFDVLSDMLLNAHLGEDAIQREKGVILEEYRMYLDNPRSLAATNFDNLIFGDHPLGWDIIGTPANIKRFKRNEIAAYKADLYTSNNIVVAVAGNTTVEAVTKLINQYLPYSKSKNINRPLPYKPLKDLPKAVNHVVKDTEQAHLLLGTRTFGGDHKDRYAADLLAIILGGGMSSRLFLNVREELGLAYYIHSFFHPYADTGYFAVAAGVDKTRVDVAINQIFTELKNIAQEGVTPSELKKAQEYIIGHLVLELEHSDEIAYLFGVRWLLYGRLQDVEAIKKAIKAVTVRDLNRIARKFFTEQNLVLTVVGPKTLSDTIKKSYKLNTK